MRKILVVVDMQNDFISGSLGTQEAVRIVPKVLDKIDTYDIKDIYVTMDTHQSNYLETNEGRHLPVVHCVEGTWGWELQEDLKAALAGATVVHKPTFGSTALMELLTKEYRSMDSAGEAFSVELIGLCTDICVVSNALLVKAAMPEINVKVDGSCCAGVTPESHEAALTTMKMCQIEVF